MAAGLTGGQAGQGVQLQRVGALVPRPGHLHVGAAVSSLTPLNSLLECTATLSWLLPPSNTWFVVRLSSYFDFTALCRSTASMLAAIAWCSRRPPSAARARSTSAGSASSGSSSSSSARVDLQLATDLNSDSLVVVWLVCLCSERSSCGESVARCANHTLLASLTIAWSAQGESFARGDPLAQRYGTMFEQYHSHAL